MPTSSTEQKIAVLLVNLGTPASFKPQDVRRYLREFLSDPRVMDMHSFFRWLLVNLMIVPFRSRSSARFYKNIWTKEGSPLLSFSLQLESLLQKELGENYFVKLGMRYQFPSMRQTLKELLSHPVKKLIVIPLFPQYASATTGSVIENLFSLLKNQFIFTNVSIVSHFHDHPLFIKAFSSIISSYDLKNYDHLVMSFHGLPSKQLKRSNPFNACNSNTACCPEMHLSSHYCYKAACHATARHIAASLGLHEKNYTVCFQSRLGRSEWIEPYTCDIIKKLAEEGKKKILVTCPSFICDCLETLYEIQIEYEHHFKKHGGESLTLVQGLNTHTLWIKTLVDIIEKESGILCSHSPIKAKSCVTS